GRNPVPLGGCFLRPVELSTSILLVRPVFGTGTPVLSVHVCAPQNGSLVEEVQGNSRVVKLFDDRRPILCLLQPLPLGFPVHPFVALPNVIVSNLLGAEMRPMAIES
ncbi:hypothetical protein EV401DRAFT_1905140, partial [Pisolithus croceorrhizus]